MPGAMGSCRFPIALLCLSALLLLAAPVAPAASDGGCDLVASPAGSNSASGAPGDPLRGARALVAALERGQVGCFESGTYRFRELKITERGITLTSVPEGKATLRGRIWIARGANRVTISDIHLDGRSGNHDLPSPTVNAHRARFERVDVTNHHTGICFALGSPVWGRAVGTVITHSKVHDCGRLPSENQDHGIYLAAASKTKIRHNWIYRNADRGIQLYPDAQRTRVVHNVIYGNGEGIIFSGDRKIAANHTLVAENIIAASKIRSNVESYFEPGGPVGRRNVVRFNCVRGAPSGYYAGPEKSGIQQDEVGFRAAHNVFARPRFVDPAHGDFRLRDDSPCADLGGKVSLRRPKPSGGRKVRLQGQLPGPPVGKVKVQFKRRGHWKTLTRRRVRASSFKVRVKVPRRLKAKRLHVRAEAPGHAPSRSVTLRLRRHA
jgi:Right handed beta helix region